jgi:hypothetical protein
MNTENQVIITAIVDNELRQVLRAQRTLDVIPHKQSYYQLHMMTSLPGFAQYNHTFQFSSTRRLTPDDELHFIAYLDDSGDVIYSESELVAEWVEDGEFVYSYQVTVRYASIDARPEIGLTLIIKGDNLINLRVKRRIVSTVTIASESVVKTLPSKFTRYMEASKQTFKVNAV